MLFLFDKYCILFMTIVHVPHWYLLYGVKCFKCEHELWVVNVFIRKKIFKAYYGFRVLYVFPFPSAGHWPIGSGRDNLLVPVLPCSCKFSSATSFFSLRFRSAGLPVTVICFIHRLQHLLGHSWAPLHHHLFPCPSRLSSPSATTLIILSISTLSSPYRQLFPAVFVCCCNCGLHRWLLLWGGDRWGSSAPLLRQAWI